MRVMVGDQEVAVCRVQLDLQSTFASDEEADAGFVKATIEAYVELG